MCHIRKCKTCTSMYPCMNGSQGLTKYVSDSVASLSSLVQTACHGPQLQPESRSETGEAMSFSDGAVPSIVVRYSSCVDEPHDAVNIAERCNCSAYEEINRLRSNEQRLRTYIQALRRDLINNEESTSELKKEVHLLRNAYEQEKESTGWMLKRVETLEKTLNERLHEIVEVVEYCKHLLMDD